MEVGRFVYGWGQKTARTNFVPIFGDSVAKKRSSSEVKVEIT
jgi:hypothetical protein